MGLYVTGSPFTGRPSVETPMVRPSMRAPGESLPPIGRRSGFDDTPVAPPWTGPFDHAANILTRMGVDVAASYSLAVAEEKAPSGRVNLLA